MDDDASDARTLIRLGKLDESEAKNRNAQRTRAAGLVFGAGKTISGVPKKPYHGDRELQQDLRHSKTAERIAFAGMPPGPSGRTRMASLIRATGSTILGARSSWRGERESIFRRLRNQ